jgi:hypothetical protein
MSETEVPKSFFTFLQPFDGAPLEELKQGSFVKARKNDISFDVSDEVRLAVRIQGKLEEMATSVMRHLVTILPPPTPEHIETWVQYQPNVQEVLKYRKLSTSQDTVAILASLLAQSYIEFGKGILAPGSDLDLISASSE